MNVKGAMEHQKYKVLVMKLYERLVSMILFL